MSNAIDKRLTSRLTLSLALLGLGATPLLAQASEEGKGEACLRCHEAGDLKGADAASVLDLLKQPSPRVHRKFAELTLEEVEAILASFGE